MSDRYTKEEARRHEQVVLDVIFDTPEMLHTCERCCGEGELICGGCGGTGGETYVCTRCNGQGVRDCPDCRC